MRAVLLSVSLLCVCSTSSATLWQESVTPQEKALVFAAAREIVRESVTDAYRDSSMAKLERELASPFSRWSKSSGWNVFFASESVVVEFSLLSNEVIHFEFQPRKNPENPVSGEEPISLEEASSIARRALDNQLNADWSAEEPVLDQSSTVGARFVVRPHHCNLPYANQRAEVLVDRFSGVVEVMTKSFAFLPGIARGGDFAITDALQQQLHAIALDAYARWRPLGDGTITGGEVNYSIPLFDRCDNEMTPQDIEIMRNKQVMPMYCLNIRGHRDDRMVQVTVFVDAIDKRPIAIRERVLPDGRLDVGGASTDSSSKKPEPIKEMTWPDGRALKYKQIEKAPDGLGDDGRVVVTTNGGRILELRVDRAKRVVWLPESKNQPGLAFKPNDSSWKRVVAGLDRAVSKFPSKT